MPPYSVHSYSFNLLRQLFVEGSHGGNEDINNKSHTLYLDGYLTAIEAKTIVVEKGYTDRDFLEDFAAYHVRCFLGYQRFCNRLHFFKVDFDQAKFEEYILRHFPIDDLQKNYLGFIVVKPLPSTVVGRTCLATYPSNPPGRQRYFPTVGSEQANLYGIDLKLPSLPFQEQDQDVAACASSALWSVLNGSSRLFQNPTPSPVEITRAAGLHYRLENRHFPAGGGLTSNQIADAIRSVGLEPHALAVEQPFVLKIATLAYLQAGIPCMLLGELIQVTQNNTHTTIGGHAIAVTGYSAPTGTVGTPIRPGGCCFRALTVDRFYCHDDQVGPFASLSFTPLGLSAPSSSHVLIPKVLIAPLYHKVRISVLQIVELNQQIDIIIETFRQAQLINIQSRIVWDIRLITSNEFRSELALSNVDDNHKMHLLTREYPRFMWRLHTSSNGNNLFAVILDATDLMQGQLIVEVIPYDKPVCSAIAAALPSIGNFVGFLRSTRIFFDWFNKNLKFL